MGPASTGIEVSAGLLERIRASWCLELDGQDDPLPVPTASASALSLSPPRPSSSSSSSAWMHVNLHAALVLTIEELENQGFAAGQIQQAVRAVLQSYVCKKDALISLMHDGQRGGVRRGVSGLADMLRSATLNYLLSRLDRDELPGYYAETSRMVDQGRVVAVGRVEGGAVDGENAGNAERDRVEKDLARKRTEAAAAEAAAKAREEKIAREAEQEREDAARRKQWILEQQMACGSDDGWDESEVSVSDSDGEIEDWELWGSPEEIAKKRAEKARKEMRREDKVALLAREMRGAKAAVAKAKREGDKGALKGFGAVIGKLRREMGELGIDDAELDAVVSDEEGCDGDDDGVAPGEATEGPPAAPSAPSPSSPLSSSSSSSSDFCVDMFEQMEQMEPTVAKRINPAYASIVEHLRDWRDGQPAAKGKGGNSNPNQGKKQVTPRQKHPKAVLQQAAQREGWGAPRFEKLPGGGKRGVGDPHADTIRFQALLEVKASSSKATKKAKTRLGIHRFVLPPELDGWQTATEAQDAVSTKALMDLFGAAENVDRIEWELLKDPFVDFVLEVAEWEGNGETVTEDRTRERDDFVTKALSEVQSQISITWSIDGEDGQDMLRHRRVAMDEALMRAIGEKAALLERPEVSKRSEALATAFSDWNESKAGKSWKVKRDALPVTQIREDLLKALEVYDVVLVSGETGSGKTTQVPQMLLDGCLESFRGAQCSIVCTQPRRIAAISVADRVSEERGEAGPGKKGALVGYSVRFDSATNTTTRLEFCTTGILLRRLSSDPALLKLSHVVVDEVHERTMQSDFLIAMLRELVVKRRLAGLPLKVILMSATMNTEVISDYFAGCPVLSASGRTFPVQHLFLEDVYEDTGYVLDVESSASHRDFQSRARQKILENSAGSKNKALIKSNWGDQAGDTILNPNVDAASLTAMMEESQGGYSVRTVRNLSRVNEDRIDMDLVEHVVLHIHETQAPGAILVFVPGMAEIDNLSRRLMSQRCLQGHVVVPLHSSISPKDQKNAFRLHEAGVRKIVISTNIAETSVTIEDIVYVIDTGKHKERRHDASRSMSMLVEDSVSVANANQRKGRAGRVREGTCYALYTRQCYEKRMKKFQTPEIMRVPLEEMILQIHALRLGDTADDFLSKVIQPPSRKAVQGATENLIQAGALTKTEELTSLGSQLAALPVDVNIGKILIMGALLQCMSPALSIAACLSHKSPFAAVQDKDDIKSAMAPFLSNASVAAGQQSDHLVLAAAVQGWIDAKASGGMSTASKFAKKYRLSVPNVSTIMDMRDQFAGMLESAGLAQRGDSSSSPTTIKWYDDASCPQNANKTSPEVIKAVLVASLHPSVALVDEVVPGSTPTWHDGAGAVNIHPTSILSEISGGALQRPFVVYSEKMKTSRVFLRDCSVASPLAIMLFGREVTVEHRSSLVVVDGWIKIKVTGRCAAILMAVREKLDDLLRGGADSRDDRGGRDRLEKDDRLHILTSLLKEEAAMSAMFK